MLCVTLSTGCLRSWICPKPKPCPECPAPRTITVQEPCWEKVPALPLDPSEIGATLTEDQLKKLAASFVILANYVHDQESRCGKNEPSPEGDGETDGE